MSDAPLLKTNILYDLLYLGYHKKAEVAKTATLSSNNTDKQTA